MKTKDGQKAVLMRGEYYLWKREQNVFFFFFVAVESKMIVTVRRYVENIDTKIRPFLMDLKKKLV